MLPTLKLKGRLYPPNGDPKLKKQLDEWIPIDYIIDWFRQRLHKTGIENRVLILRAETASGKSTLFPPELYKAFVRSNGGPGIICTQPRVITAIENVNEMLKHYSDVLRLGETVGWSTKFNKLRPQKTGLLSATIGTLAQQLRVMTDEEIISRYRFILIDETHERDLQTDITIMMLKQLLLRHAGEPRCPFVVLMSATFEPEPFLRYFGLDLMKNYIWITGETVGFDEMWDWNSGRVVEDYTKSAAALVEKIVREAPNEDPEMADILIFMPGKKEFSETRKHLMAVNDRLVADSLRPVSILEIDSESVRTRDADYQLALYIPSKEHKVMIRGRQYTPGRRCIISTNVAETGLTLPNLKYVIDAGYNREVEFNPVYGVQGLITKPAPKSRIRQRRGRAGRKFRGVFYPLYPRDIYEKLPDFQLPQILINDISSVLLDIINEQLRAKTLAGDRDPEFSIEHMDMLNPPTPDALAAGLEKLYVLGYIAPRSKWRWFPHDLSHESKLAEIKSMLSHDGQAAVDIGAQKVRFGLTGLGLIARNLPAMPPEISRMILAAYSWGCSVLDMITIGAYLMIDPKSFVATVPGSSPAPINWDNVYRSGFPGFMVSKNMYYKIRVLTGDEFMDGLILYNALKSMISNINLGAAIGSIFAWCKHNNISYSACLEMIKLRDEIIEQMLSNGMNVFLHESSSLWNATEDTIMDIITRIKYCIYDGFRMNLLTKVGTEYRTEMGLVVETPRLILHDKESAVFAEFSGLEFLTKLRPQNLLYSQLKLKLDRRTNMYSVVAERVCMLDGFVTPDRKFSS
jgi:HrpA-like helicases